MVALALALLAPLQSPYGVLSNGLAIGPVGRGGRTSVQVDPLAKLIVDGTLDPKEGAEVGGRRWQRVQSDKDGWFQGGPFSGGYAAFQVDSPKREIVILNAAGNSAAWVNGVARPGDPYSYGWSRLPVVLEKGSNQLLFSSRRGRMRAEIQPSKTPAFLNLGDMTTADVVMGERSPIWCAVVVGNATEASTSELEIRASVSGAPLSVTKLPSFLPLQCRKAGFKVQVPNTTKPGTFKVTLTLASKGKELDRQSFDIRVRGPQDTVKRTFRSDIDGSIQYYAIRPSLKPNPEALVLSLHGASVEALSQADAYSGKAWCAIACPTNRRPFGFDWEEIGRLDALEVLDHATKALKPQADQIYLTGHSMGGHGTWQVSVNNPGRFAAIGPSAGWSTFFSYGGGVRYPNPSPAEAILNRASNPSDTMALLPNLADLGVYILHGDADDNVPVSEARKMAAALGDFHKDWRIWEEKGAGHWWENSSEPGAECMDWAPMYDMFSRRRIPGSTQRRQIDFSTISPGIANSLGWVTIAQQTKPFELSRVKADCDPFLGRIRLTTTNTALVCLDLLESPVLNGKRIEVNADGQKVPVTPRADGKIWLSFGYDRWTESAPPKLSEKGPHRFGGFKDIFKNNVVFIYGTKGDAAENAWSLAKARYDAEAFWYVGNGAPQVMADTEFSLAKTKDRNVLLYGNAETNAAWPLLLRDSPVGVNRKTVKVGDKALSGEDLAIAFIRPRQDSDKASVGVLGGTGMNGLRLSERLPLFTSGAGFPDVLVLDSSSLIDGTKGVRAAGFFGNDWGVMSGDFAW